jgi:hypothetical protein
MGNKWVEWKALCAEVEWVHQPGSSRQHFCVLVAVASVSLCIALQHVAFLWLYLCRPQTLQRSTGQDIANLLWGLGHIHDQQQQQRPDQGGDSAAPPSHFISAEQLLVLARRLLEVRKHPGTVMRNLQCCLLLTSTGRTPLQIVRLCVVVAHDPRGQRICECKISTAA